jgi:hypothetical protein
VIHVYPTQADQSAQDIHTIRTNDSYSNYVFHVEYKWGTKRFAPRANTDRDSGLLFHLCNDLNKVWPDCVEFQIASAPWPNDWVTGNIFTLYTKIDWTYGMKSGQQVFADNGTKTSIGASGQIQRGLTPEQLNSNTDWNILELTVHGNKDAEYKVNGTVANRVFNPQCYVNGAWQPLDHGPLALQAEYAEVYYRNIKIKVLP